MQNIEANKATTREFLAAIAVLDLARMVPLLTPDFAIETMGSSVFGGTRSGAEVAKVVQLMSEMVPDGVRLELISMMAEGNRVACQLEGYGVTVSGKRYDNKYLYLLEFRDGKIAKLTEYMDSLLNEQCFGDELRKKLGRDKV